MIDVLATEPQYLSHLAPVWFALDPSERGTFTVHPRILLHARKLGIETTRAQGTGSVCVVASYADERRVKRRPVVLLEHGAGQSYSFGAAGHPSYSGGARHDVVLFLSPNETVAARWRACYPHSRVEVIGAEPRMDRYYRRLGRDRLGGRGGFDSFHSPPVVAVAFHWPGHNVVPEAGNAWPTFGPHLGALTEHFTVLGHGHPRVIKSLRPHYERMGIEVVEDADEVFERADLLVWDNTSLGWEWASLDRPTVLMNSPAYRREVTHHLRFWTHADIGPQVDDPADLVAACRLALDDPLIFTKARRRMADAVFPIRDGCASERAAAAIRNLVSSPDLPRRTRMPSTDPYAPRSRGTARRAVVEQEPEQPEPDSAPTATEDEYGALIERLRSVGADDMFIEELGETWQARNEEQRRGMLGQYEKMTDDELGDAFHERRKVMASEQALTGTVQPREDNV